MAARKRSDLVAAEEYLEESFHKLLSVGAMTNVFTSLENLVDALKRKVAVSEAIRWCDRGIELAEQQGNDNVVEDFQELRADLSEDR